MTSSIINWCVLIVVQFQLSYSTDKKKLLLLWYIVKYFSENVLHVCDVLFVIIFLF